MLNSANIIFAIVTVFRRIYQYSEVFLDMLHEELSPPDCRLVQGVLPPPGHRLVQGRVHPHLPAVTSLQHCSTAAAHLPCSQQYFVVSYTLPSRDRQL